MAAEPPAGPGVVVGEIARPHGIRGEVVVNLLTEHTERFAPGSRVRIGPSPEEATPTAVVRSRLHQGRPIVLFEDVPDRNAAELLRGALVFAPPDDAPALEDDAWWEHDLVGLEVRDTAGSPLGTLSRILSRAEQDLWEMETASGPVLIPATPAIVRTVDPAAGVVVIDPPPGLLGDEEREAPERP